VKLRRRRCRSVGRVLLRDKKHWVRRLPGKLLHNIISHGIARIAEFLTGDWLEVVAFGLTSPALKCMGEGEIIDELRVIISEQERTTAYFTFSSQMRHSTNFVSMATRTVLFSTRTRKPSSSFRGKRYVSYAEKFIPPLSFGRQYLRNLATNINSFLARDFHMKSGMKYLIESFYRSIVEGAPDPIPHTQILLTGRIMDMIFAQFAAQQKAETCVLAAVRLAMELLLEAWRGRRWVTALDGPVAAVGLSHRRVRVPSLPGTCCEQAASPDGMCTARETGRRQVRA
jgi:hypothetical protein